ncbi:hypothetical protein [Neorhizobium petrolearium]|uniref:hypothetical protein n=1 Tax=Neorhizobium petrolearium TaxID=515361 RepID=UPI003F162318
MIGFISGALLVLPGVTVVTKSLDELFLVFDGIHRVVAGQQPGAAFTAGSGPIASSAPAIAYHLSGSYGAAMPLAMGFFVVLTSVVASHVLATRLRPVLALGFAAFLLLILAAPMSLGDPVTALSFARFDIRIGWVALALLLVLYLRPSDRLLRTVVADAVCAALLTLIIVYTRLTYAVVATIFLMLMLTDRQQWRTAVLALVIISGVLAIVQLTWVDTTAYVAGAWKTFQADGVWGGSPWDFFQRGLAHLADFLLLGILAGLALRSNWGLRLMLFFLLCSVGGLWIISHNVQPWGIISIHAAAVVAAELLLRRMEQRPQDGQGQIVNASGVKLFFLAFVLPTSLHCGIALALHAGAASLRAGDAVTLSRIDGVYSANLWTEGDYRGQVWYLALVAQGFDLLRQSNQPPGRITVIGEVDPFSTALDLPPRPSEEGDLRWNTLLTQDTSVEPGELIKNADTVLFRKPADSPSGLQQRTLSFLYENFSQSGESEFWILFHRAASAAGPQAPGPAPR